MDTKCNYIAYEVVQSARSVAISVSLSLVDELKPLSFSSTPHLPEYSIPNLSKYKIHKLYEHYCEPDTNVAGSLMI